MSSRQDKPEPTVDQLPHGVEVAGVARGLGHDVQDDLPQTVEPPVADEVARPAGRCGVEGRGGDDVVRALDLPPLYVEHGSDRHVRSDQPRVGFFG
jgi:hypothetical protein